MYYYEYYNNNIIFCKEKMMNNMEEKQLSLKKSGMTLYTDDLVWGDGTHPSTLGCIELLNKIPIVVGEYYYKGCNSTTYYHWHPQQYITYRIKDTKDQWGFYKKQRFFPTITIVSDKTNYSLDVEYDCFIIAVEKTKASGLKYSLDTDEKYSGSESRYSCLETEKYYYFINTYFYISNRIN